MLIPFTWYQTAFTWTKLAQMRMFSLNMAKFDFYEYNLFTMVSDHPQLSFDSFWCGT